MKKKFLLPIIIGILILLPNSSHAVLQANGNSGAMYKINDWVSKVREMEKLGGAMGLSEELNDNFTSKTSNNIDVHMEKNTEYGAMAILSASAYGNPNVIGNGETTTGNSTGVVINTVNWEVTARYHPKTCLVNIANSARRYTDNYNGTTYYKKSGDAIEETLGWHNTPYKEIRLWFSDLGNSAYEGSLIRSCDGIFSFYTYGFGYSGYANINNGFKTRAVVVCGEGL